MICTVTDSVEEFLSGSSVKERVQSITLPRANHRTEMTE
jgi:hypothetical protein